MPWLSDLEQKLKLGSW